MITLVEAVAQHAQETPEKLAVAFRRERLSYADVWARAQCFAAQLAQAGVGPGDRVALVCLSKPSTAVAYLAIHVLGVIAVMVDKTADDEVVARIVEASGSVAVVSEARKDVAVRWVSPKDCDDVADACELTACVPEAEDISDILFTTGTTGEPKGVALSYRAIEAISKHNAEGVGMRADDVVLIPLPLHHSLALRVLRTVLFLGATAVLQNGFTFARDVERNIDAFGCTGMVAVATSMENVRAQMRGRFGEIVGRLRYVELGAGPVSSALREQLVAQLPNTRIFNSYGSSETGGTVFLDIAGSLAGAGKDSAGLPVSGAQVRFVGAAAAGEEPREGRLAFRGPMVMSGYWGRDDLTQEVFDDGWLLSGDRARMDADGYIYLLGRADDLIVMGGENVSPVEVENAASLCAGVAECACIGVADPEGKLGQIPVLYVAPTGPELSEARLRAEMDARLGRNKSPKAYVVVDAIPRNAMLKVRKGRLRELWDECGEELSLGPVTRSVMARRSVRDFQRRCVPPAIVDVIVRAGYHAPTGHNMQSWRFTVLEDAGTIAALKEATAEAAKGTKVHLYGFEEPAFVVIVSNDRRNPDGCQDASAAAENMFLVAQEFGLGSTWVNALMTLRDVEPVKSLLDGLGVPECHVVWCCALFGYPVERGAKMARKTDVVRYVDRTE